ncbi:hypothetical protein OSB04_000917 [Centaurea solstitialis]|uniref:Uncharacterized protein n=1 Tax=Centaurea solstitialis TaxID=347529 RepID=A0AA38WUR4_9ASTR|nr:hypothetical protein OSB04_000917 [Centaurea solstitialis]
MRILVTQDSTNGLSNSFLLDDDSSIPFFVDDMMRTMDMISVSDIEPPPLLRENASFSFLATRKLLMDKCLSKHPLV